MEDSKRKLNEKELEMVSGGEGFPPEAGDYTGGANIPHTPQNTDGGKNIPQSESDFNHKRKP